MERVNCSNDDEWKAYVARTRPLWGLPEAAIRPKGTYNFPKVMDQSPDLRPIKVYIVGPPGGDKTAAVRVINHVAPGLANGLEPKLGKSSKLEALMDKLIARDATSRDELVEHSPLTLVCCWIPVFAPNLSADSLEQIKWKFIFHHVASANKVYRYLVFVAPYRDPPFTRKTWDGRNLRAFTEREKASFNDKLDQLWTAIEDIPKISCGPGILVIKAACETLVGKRIFLSLVH